jgi:1-acyl-sn-glycerol-3-phosphate acyltransferase
VRVTTRYRVMWLTLRLLVRALFRVRVTGLERWPDPPFCIVINHHNGWDPLIVTGVVPLEPRITWFGPREADFSRGFKNRVMGFFGGVIPFDPEKTTLTSAVRTVRSLFAANGALGIFAEGRAHFRETALEPFEDGAVAFAAGAGVPIVPCAVVGTTYLWLGKRVRVSFGDAIVTAGIRGTAARGELTDRVRDAMRAMLPDHEPGPPGARPLRRFLTDLLNGPEDAARRVATLGE